MDKEKGKNVRQRGKTSSRPCWAPSPPLLKLVRRALGTTLSAPGSKIRKHRRGLAGCPLAQLLLELGQEARIPANPKANGRDNIA